MKITRMLLVFIVCFVFVECTPSKSLPPPVEEPKIIYVFRQREPVTLELIHDIKNEITQADFYLSTSIYVFLPSLVEDRKIIDGDYERKTNTDTDRIQILYDSPGKFVFLTSDEQRINISFENITGNIILSFVRVFGNRVNRYELDSAERNNSNLQIYFPQDKPYLVIHTREVQNQNIIPAQGIPYSEALSPPNDDSPRPILHALGKPKLNESYINAIANYLCDTRRPKIPYSVAGSGFDRSSVVQIITFYFEEAKLEGVNPDLAIAQMIQNLQYFSDAKVYRELREAHNYGKLVFARNIRNDYWDGKAFTGRNIGERRRNGIRAHIQFLKRLANGSLNSSHVIVLPMPIWNELAGAAGKRQTLADISKSWGGSNPTIYEKNIRDVYRKLTDHLGIV